MNGWTDDLFPPIQAVSYANAVAARFPSVPVHLRFASIGHPRAQSKKADRNTAGQRRHRLPRPLPPAGRDGGERAWPPCAGAWVHVPGLGSLDRAVRRRLLGRAVARLADLHERAGASDCGLATCRATSREPRCSAIQRSGPVGNQVAGVKTDGEAGARRAWP